MKTLVQQGTNVSLFLFEDSETVNVGDDQTTIGSPANTFVVDCNSSNTSLVENVPDKENYIGSKFLYTTVDGWTSNPDYIEPQVIDYDSN